jgi:hypothetical protein
VSSVLHDFWITTEPRIPVQHITTELVGTGEPVLDGNIRWTARIDYTDWGRSDRIETSGTSSSLNFDVDFGPNLVLGGQFALRCVIPVRYSDGSTQTTEATAYCRVTGRNPSKDEIRRYLGTLPLQVTAYHESKFRQFVPQTGLPYVKNGENGIDVGIMQINKPIPYNEFWHWKRNVKEGKLRYASAQRKAGEYPATLRRNFPQVTDFSPHQLQMETFNRYNRGASTKYPYWVWDEASNAWQRKWNYVTYADTSWDYLERVKTGNPPADW